MNSWLTNNFFSQVLLLEVRKQISYRLDFWLNLLSVVIVNLILAYFFWQAVFSATGSEVLGGYTFKGMILYQLIVSFVQLLVRGADVGFIAREVYDGSFTRYLLYPVSFSRYKIAVYAAHSLTHLVYLSLAMLAFYLFIGWPDESIINITTVMMAIVSSCVAAYLYFLLSGCFELISFWAENVWGLTVMLRFITGLLGGGLIPLSFFPERAAAILSASPFALVTSIPVRCFMGQVGAEEWLISLLTAAVWIALFHVIFQAILRRGLLRYTGVGI